MRKLITITAPTCSGKNHLQGELLKRGFTNLVSFTTRPKREGEVEGVDYYFVDHGSVNFENRDRFAEKNLVNNFWYGILADEIFKAVEKGNPILSIVDPHGAEQLNDFCCRHEIEYLSVFLNNPVEVRLVRFLERFKNDTNARLDVYANRLKHIFSEEEHWLFAMPYGLYFNNYDSSNTEFVVNSILEKVGK